MTIKVWVGAAMVVAAIAGLTQQVQASDAAPGSAIHGFGDYSIKPDYITPRGLLVTNAGVTSQILGGLVFLTSANTSVVAGLWTDLDSDPRTKTSNLNTWNELDYFIGFNYSPTKQVKLGVTYVTFISPPGAFKNEQNIEFSASYDDSSDSAFSFQPYAKFFWAVDGDSTVVLGRKGNTFDVELGMVPTLKVADLPVTLTAPTWFTVGPKSYWSGGTSPTFFPTSGSNLGVVSTGLTAKVPAHFVPARFGNWYLYAGVQYYHLINDSLVDANSLTTGATGKGHNNVINGFAGLGFGF